MLWIALLACAEPPPPVARNPRTAGDPPVHPDSRPHADPQPADSPVDQGVRRWDCSGIDPADPAPLGGKVALTFDDGPHAVHTAAIIDVLRGHDAPATFFALGERLSDPSTWPLVDEIVADPLLSLANHSWDHANLTSLSSGGVAAEIDDTNEIIATFGTQAEFFRFPYGASDCDDVDSIAERGMRVAGWHIDTADWCYAAVGTPGSCRTADYWRIPSAYEDDMLGFTLEQVHRFDGGVILLHDIHSYTTSILDTLILMLQADGFDLVSLTDLDAFPLLNAGTPADLPYLGEACDAQDDQCWQIEYLSWCEQGVCVLPCEGLCSDRPGAATTFCATVGGTEGLCVARAEDRNDDCATLPETSTETRARWVGTSGAAHETVDVCIPDTWTD